MVDPGAGWGGGGGGGGKGGLGLFMMAVGLGSCYLWKEEASGSYLRWKLGGYREMAEC
jgi:hypothetical protein